MTASVSNLMDFTQRALAGCKPPAETIIMDLYTDDELDKSFLENVFVTLD
jgi:hypothetical protein